MITERKCLNCGKIFSSEVKRKYCSHECRVEFRRSVKIEEELKAVTPKKRTKKKKFLSINEVLALGRRHNIIGYSNILLAIERGEIKV